MRAALLIIVLSGSAFADELELKWNGHVQSDLQLRVEDKEIGAYYDHHEAPAGPAWAQATLGLKLDAAFGRFKGVAQLDVVADAFSAPIGDLADLSRIEAVDPVRIEALALYVDMKDLFVDGLDLRVGQQTILWGVGDQFNPTNNLNHDDLRDILLFGKQAGNFMAKLDWWPTEELSFTGVLVPLFKPALLPRTASLGVGAVDRTPFVDPFLRHRIEAENAAAAQAFGAPTVVEKALPVLPDATLQNMPFSFRAAATIAEQDIALSYYHGRTDFPIPEANHARYDTTAAQCDPLDMSSCIMGLIKTSVTLGYPEMQVVGLNAAGELPLSWISSKLEGLGYRLEAALIIPQEVTLHVSNDRLALPMPQPAGEYDYDADGVPGGPTPVVVEDTPFAKWTLGLDYTFGPHVYVNAQWVHGLPDEYGTGKAVRQSGVTSDTGSTLVCALTKDGTQCARELLRPRIADYLVLGMDFKLMNNALLLRLFTILDLSGIVEETYDQQAGARVSTSHSPFSSAGFSAEIYPELNYNFGNGLDLGLGALAQLGKTYTKFGDPAAGGSLVWTRARFAF